MMRDKDSTISLNDGYVFRRAKATETIAAAKKTKNLLSFGKVFLNLICYHAGNAYAKKING